MSTNASPVPSETNLQSTPAPPAEFHPLRVWPPILLLLGMILFRLLPSMVEDGPPMLWMSAAFGPVLCALLTLLWWPFLSRANIREKLAGLAGLVVVAVIAILSQHRSMMGPPTTLVTIPLGMAAFALPLILLARVLSPSRTVVAVLSAALGFGFSCLLRSEGMWGDFAPGIFWRWNASSEEKFLAYKPQPSEKTLEALNSELVARSLEAPEWPGFRGADRIGVQRGTRLETDWNAHSAKLLWKVPVGPAWSSFAVAGELLFTQEQRRAEEAVVCYEASTGTERWAYVLTSRFDDPLGGPGPRATPTLANGSVYAQGAQGWLVRLDARTGTPAWKVDLRQQANREPPMWGFSSSPLVVGSVVVTYAGGANDKGILAFDVEHGEMKWSVPAGEHSYGSPQAANVAGHRVILLLTNNGMNVLDPDSGQPWMNYDWPFQGYRALQAQVVDGDNVLIPTGMGAGTRRIRLAVDGERWDATEVWTSRDLKPDFNDCVVHEGHVYGFDGGVFACLRLDTGKRLWKGGRYGKGQVLLLADSNMLLVASETGEIVLLETNPTKLHEITRFQAVEGKTWNHPVVVGDRLYVRNAQEAACFQLPIKF